MYYVIPLALTFSLVSVRAITIDVGSAVNAGKLAKKSITLSDAEVIKMAEEARIEMDKANTVAPPGNKYHIRLQKLVSNHKKVGNIPLNFKVYLTPTVNAFAMADGTVRVFSGIMDVMDDEQLLFVVGHELGHIYHNHSKKKFRVAYSAAAARQGMTIGAGRLASLAGSDLGQFFEDVINSQFSQKEEVQADDYGLEFLKTNRYKLRGAPQALRTLAKMAQGKHDFLSSHPEPLARAARMEKKAE